MGPWGDEKIITELKDALDSVTVDDGLAAIQAKIATTKTCPMCLGTGDAPFYIGSWECRYCHGTGRIKRLYWYRWLVVAGIV